MDPLKQRLRLLAADLRIWLLAALLLLSLAATFTAASASRDRGLTRESIWLLEASDQRIEYYRHVRKLDLTAISRPEAIDAAYRPHSALPPLMPAIVATARGTTRAAADLSPARVANITNAIFFGAFVLLLGLMGLEVGGPFGALGAAVGAMTVPRLFGVATIPGFAMAGLFFLTLTPWLMHRARWSALATLGAIASLVLAVQATVVLGLFVWLPWVYLAVTRPGQRSPAGFTATPPQPLRNLAIVPVGLVVGLFLYPWIWIETKDHLLGWLTHFLRQPAEPFSYLGEVWGHRRIPWHAAPFILAVTVPPAFLFLALAGMRGGPTYQRLSQLRGLGFLRYLPFRPEREDARPVTLLDRSHTRADALRLARVMLVVTLGLPLIYRGPTFGGVDLLSLAVPWLLVLAAAGLQRLVHIAMDSVPWRTIVRRDGVRGSIAGLHVAVVTVLAALLLVPPALEVSRYHPLEEAYYNWLIGGPDGARARGLPRYPSGPMPSDVLDDLVAEARASGREQLGIGFLLPGRGYDQAVRRAISEQRVPPGVHLTPTVYEADIAILAHDDLDPGYESAATDFFRTVSGAGSEGSYQLLVYERGAVPIFSIAIAPR